MKIAIIGAGFTGLTAALRLSQKGHQVIVFEKESVCAGLAAGFRQKTWNWSLENFFHHLFPSDSVAKKLIAELGLADKLFFTRPKTSIFLKGRVSQFDSPLSLFFFPFLSFPEKLRTGLVTSYLKLTNNWQKLEKITAQKWLKKHYGSRIYQILWEPLLRAKFGDQTEKISMSWFWARIKKRSAKLGYLEGGFQVLIDKLIQKIKENGGKILLGHEIKNLNDTYHDSDFDKVIITTPTQTFFKTKLPQMLSALNLVLILKEKFLKDGTYWLNINQPGFPFVAVVEHTNFVDPKYYGGNHILYVGGYYPQNHHYFKMSKEQIFQEFLPYLQKINPSFNFRLFTIYYLLFTNLYAQPIIPINYSKIIPSHQTPIPNVYLANMQQVYPWDRGVNYAIEMGEKVANEII